MMPTAAEQHSTITLTFLDSLEIPRTANIDERLSDAVVGPVLSPIVENLRVFSSTQGPERDVTRNR